MRKDPRVYLLHMLECVRRIEAYTSEGEERFMRDMLIQDAVLRNLQVLVLSGLQANPIFVG
jgi:uncharacterized protein with HEPN domain